MTLREAAQRVLAEYDNDSVGFKLFGALEDLRAALAEDALDRMSEDERRLGIQMQPVQEPVAWRVQRSDGQYELYFLKAAAERAAECYIKRPPVEPLYTAPPQRKPLTEEEIYAAIKGVDSLRAVEVARAIEKAHGIE